MPKKKDERVSIKVTPRALQAIRHIQRPYEDRMEKAPGQHDIVDTWLDAFENPATNAGAAIEAGGSTPSVYSQADIDLLASFAQLQQRNAPAAAALRALVRTLAREEPNEHHPDLFGEAMVAETELRAATALAGTAVPGAAGGQSEDVGVSSRAPKAGAIGSRRR